MNVSDQSGLSACARTTLSAALLLLLDGTAAAATIVVNNSGASSVAGKCTLIDAVAAVNQATAVNGCNAGDGADDLIDLTSFRQPTTITFKSPQDPSAPKVGLVNLPATSALALSKPVTLRGALNAQGQPLVTLQRSTITTVAVPEFRIIGTTADIAIDGLTISGGYL